MKKLVLTSVCALAMAGAAMAQGLINWSTAPGANILGQTNGTAISPLFGGGGANLGQGFTAGIVANGVAYYYTLLYSSQNTTGIAVAGPTNSVSGLLSSWFTTGLYATNTGTAGRIQYMSPAASAALPWGGNTDANGQSNNIVLAGWSQNLGTSWASVSNYLANWATLGSTVVGNAFFGLSNTGFFVGTDSPTPGAIWNAAAPGSQSGAGLLLSAPSSAPLELYLLPVPEPSTLALAGLGGLGMLLFRRRK